MTKSFAPNLVFYVDDDPDDIELVRDVFAAYPDVQLVTFLESYKFLRYIIESRPFERPPTLILMDINMPVLNGRELLTLLRSYEDLRSVPVILYTTSSQLSDKGFAQSLKAGFITKPDSKKLLAQTIHDLLTDCGVIS